MLLTLATSRAAFHPRMASPRLGILTMSNKDEEPQQNKLASSLSDLADASWDLFVMPGEYANSRYDRPLQPVQQKPNATSFDWGGESEEEAALRLPPVAVPVSVSRGPGENDESAGNQLSQTWTAAWAIGSAIALAVSIQVEQTIEAMLAPAA